MAGLKLFTSENNARAYKALVTAKYVGVDIQIPPFTFGVTNKTPEFLRLNPLGKIPTLETPDGGVWDSNPIARTVAKYGDREKCASLLGRTPYEEGVIDSWVSFAQNEIEWPRMAWLSPIAGYVPFSAAGLRAAKQDIQRTFAILNEHFKTHTFLVAERVTIADIILACTVLDLFKKVLSPEFRAPFRNVTRWFTTVVNQPEFLSVAGETELAETMAEYDANATTTVPAPAKEEKGKAAKETPKKKTAQQIAEEEEEAAMKKQKNAYVLAPTAKKEPVAAPTAVFVDQTVYDDDPALGADAPSLASLTFVRGDSVDVGKKHNVVVYFWGKYDTLGYPSISHFTALQKKYKALRVVGVSIDPKVEDVKAFLEDPKYAEHAKNIDFIVAHDGGKKVYNAYREVTGAVLNLPHAFLVNKEGKIVWREVHRPGDSKCLFMTQVDKFISDKPLQKNGPKPVEEDEVADVPEDMSLF